MIILSSQVRWPNHISLSCILIIAFFSVGCNKPPKAIITGPSGVSNNGVIHIPVSFGLSSYDSWDPDGIIVDYRWDLGNGDITEGQEFSRYLTENGSLTATLIVTDNEGATDKATFTVNTNKRPIASIVVTEGSAKAVVPTTVSLSALSSTDTDGSITAYSWKVGGQTTQGTTLTKTFLQPGYHEVTLSVVDDDGAEDSEAVLITATQRLFMPWQLKDRHGPME